jgi:hypothetical protein
VFFFAIFFCSFFVCSLAFFIIVLKINDCLAVSAGAQLMKRGFFYFFWNLGVGGKGAVLSRDFEFLKKRERQNKEREIKIEKGLLCAGPVQRAGSFLVPESPFCRRHFCGFNFRKQPTPFFLESFGRAGGRKGKSVVLRRGGRLRRPAAAAFRLPPPFFLSRARVQRAGVFFCGQPFGRCAPLAQLCCAEKKWKARVFVGWV